jgi:hypothetical protein
VKKYIGDHMIHTIEYDYVEAGYSEISAATLYCKNNITIRLVRDTDIDIDEQTFTIFTLDQHSAYLIVDGDVDNIITVEYGDLANKLLDPQYVKLQEVFANLTNEDA